MHQRRGWRRDPHRLQLLGVASGEAAPPLIGPFSAWGTHLVRGWQPAWRGARHPQVFRYLSHTTSVPVNRSDAHSYLHASTSCLVTTIPVPIRSTTREAAVGRFPAPQPN